MNERKRIGIRELRALQNRQTIYDDAVPGFGARRQGGKAVSFLLLYRDQGQRSRFHTIGRWGSPWTPDTARAEARRLLGEIVTGGDPQGEKLAKRAAPTVAELCDDYLADATAGRLLSRRKIPKKASTLATDRGRIERHIKPLLGNLKVSAVVRSDINRFLHAVAEGKTASKVKTKARGLAHVKGGKGTATRTVGLLGAIFTYAEQHGLREDNPVRGVTRFADGRRRRRLSNDEYASLGTALRQSVDDNEWPYAIAAACFLTLTGWRSGEALNLTWREVDLENRTAILTETKTGESFRPLSKYACDLLRAMPRHVVGVSDFVFTASRGSGPMTGFPKFWKRIASRGGLPTDITPHTLRHSFASLAADLGYSELAIGSLLGHKGHSVTSRYVHSADSVLVAAADAIAHKTAERLNDIPSITGNMVFGRSATRSKKSR